MSYIKSDDLFMCRALELALRGQGRVEPNPMVGCVLVSSGGAVVGEGWHTAFGRPHAEIEALQAAGAAARGATMYVTLEPCCHHGKTPPCTDALVAAGIRRAVIAQRDPFAQVDGAGIRALEQAGMQVEVGLLETEARRLNAPYCKLLETGRPWAIAKWAMTLDGKLAAAGPDGRWISGEAALAVVHQMRGRIDAIVIGRGTAEADDPLLTARPPGVRVPVRIVLDSQARLSPDSRLVHTRSDAPILIAASAAADPARVKRLNEAGCEILALAGESYAARLEELLLELGRRRMTNVLVEGGAQVLGTLFAARAVDEVHVFVAPGKVGPAGAPSSPLAGMGIAEMSDALGLIDPVIEPVGEDVWIHGRTAKPAGR